jgi:cell division protease FtsH
MPIETETQRSQKTPKPKQFGNSLIVFLVAFLLLNFIFVPSL